MLKTKLIFVGLKIGEVLAVVVGSWLFMQFGYWAYTNDVLGNSIPIAPLMSPGGFVLSILAGFLVLGCAAVLIIILVLVGILLKILIPNVIVYIRKWFSLWVKKNWTLAKKLSKEI